MVDVDVKCVPRGRIVLPVVREQLPDGLREEEREAAGVAADGVGEVGVELLDVVEVNGDEGALTVSNLDYN